MNTQSTDRTFIHQAYELFQHTLDLCLRYQLEQFRAKQGEPVMWTWKEVASQRPGVVQYHYYVEGELAMVHERNFLSGQQTIYTTNGKQWDLDRRNSNHISGRLRQTSPAGKKRRRKAVPA